MDNQLQYIKQYELQYIMEYLGYEYDNKKSTKESKKYKDNQGNIFIVKGNKYFNTFDNNDNGTTIDFIQNHIINEKNFYKVKLWFNDNIEKIDYISNTIDNTNNNTYNNNFESKNIMLSKKIDRQKGKEISFSLLYQKIKQNQILKYKEIRKIDINIFNMLINKKYIKYYLKYDLIKLPLYDENTDIIGILNINIKDYSKFLEKGSNKGIFHFGNKNNFKYVLLFESFLDSLSYLQLLSIKYKTEYENIINECLFISTNGSISKNNIDTIKNILNNNKNNYKIILSFDNDKIGKKYDNDIIQIIPKNIEYHINKSITKDYNDDLQMYYKQQYNNKYIDNILDIFDIFIPF